MNFVIPILFLFASYCLGSIIFKVLKITLIKTLFRFVFETCLGVVLLSQIIFGLSWLLEFNSLSIWSPIVLCITIWFGFFFRQLFRTKKIFIGVTLKQIFVLVSLTLVISFYWERLLYFTETGLFAGWRTVWGDWAAHISYASSFAYGDNFPPEFPIFSGHKLAYPFMSDFLSAIFLKMNVSLTESFLLPSILFSTATIYGFSYFGKQVLKSFRIGILGSFLFLFGGGFGFWILTPQVEWFSPSAFTFAHEFTSIPDQHIYWINKTTSEMVPQRGFLMALPLTLFSYTLAWIIYNNHKQKNLLALASLVVCSLPLVHAHSFIAVFGVFGWVFLLLLLTKKLNQKDLLSWLLATTVVIIISGIQVYYFYGSNAGKASFFTFQKGWMSHHDTANIFWFWLKNVGVILPFSLAGLLIATKKEKLFSLAYWFLFVAGNLIKFQPYEYDNTKVFTHWYIMACLLASLFIIRLFKTKMYVISLLLLVVLLYANTSGILDVLSLTKTEHNSLQMASSQQIEVANWTRSNTPKNAVFLTSQQHTHWVSMLSGRKIVLGFQGWLWSYNLPYYPREIDVKIMFSGGDKAKDLFAKYEVTHIAIGPEEKGAYDVNLEWFERETTKIYSNNLYTIFETN